MSSLIGDNAQALKRAVGSSGHLVVSTPGKLAVAIKDGMLSGAIIQARLTMLVLDGESCPLEPLSVLEPVPSLVVSLQRQIFS